MITIRHAEPSDAETIAAIYNYYVTETAVTFEEIPVELDEMGRRIQAVRSASLLWLVAEDAGRIVGFAYASPWKARAAYRFSVEITVYVAVGITKRGIGSLLYGELLTVLEARGIHSVIGGIALPNDASVALHEKFGFVKVAHFTQVGFKFNRWIDVGYWQRGLAPR